MNMRGETRRINPRPLLFAAAGLIFGIFLYCRVRFAYLRAMDFVFCALFCAFFVKRMRDLRVLAATVLLFAFFAGAGALCMHGAAERFLSGKAEGEYEVEGTVVSAVYREEAVTVTLEGLVFDGEGVSGRLQATLASEDVRVGDIVGFCANVRRYGEEDLVNGQTYYLVEDVRYRASPAEFAITGRAASPFLSLNAAIYDCLQGGMTGEEADVAYALLTGSSGNLDGDFSDAVRRGGIAHIFAVSGLHIGILFSAVYLLGRPLGRWRLLPAALVAVFYSGLCAFTVSSVRAVVMCVAGGALRTFGQKRDFPESISLAALCVLLISPAEWLSAGFRLSFGACLGLALFSGSFSRLFARLRFPKFLGDYLGSCAGVQLVTFPILMESFGYWSLWGNLLNFIVIPALTFLFLGLILCTLFALLLPFWAAFFLAFPQSMLSLLMFVFAYADFSAVLTGFSLGAGGTVWLVACFFLSERFRLSARGRAVLGVWCALLIAACAVAENVVFFGCRVNVYADGDATAVLLRTPRTRVLILDGELSLRQAEDLRMRTYGGPLDAAVVLGEGEGGIHTAAFLGADAVYARDPVETGLRETPLVFARSFSVGGIDFRYESADRLVFWTEGVAVECCFDGEAALAADFSLAEGCGSLIFYLYNGIIKVL